MPNAPGAQQNPIYCMLASGLNVSFDGGATWAPAVSPAEIPLATPSANGLMSAGLFASVGQLFTAYTDKIDFTAASATYSFIQPLVKSGFLFVGQLAMVMSTAITGTASVGLTLSAGNDASFANVLVSTAITTVAINAAAAHVPCVTSQVFSNNSGSPALDATTEIKMKVITPVTTSGTCVGRLVLLGTWVPV